MEEEPRVFVVVVVLFFEVFLCVFCFVLFFLGKA